MPRSESSKPNVSKSRRRKARPRRADRPIAGKTQAPPADQAAIQVEIDELKARPVSLKTRETALEAEVDRARTRRSLEILLHASATRMMKCLSGRTTPKTLRSKSGALFGSFDFEPKDHITLGSALGITDVDRGVKLAG